MFSSRWDFKMKVLLTMVVLVGAYSTLINGKSIDADFIDHIDQILLMASNAENQQTRPDLTPTKEDTENCICYPAYLCNNNLPIKGKPCTDNTCTTSVRMRTNDLSCDNGMVQCCRNGIYSSEMTPLATPRTPNKDRPDLSPVNPPTLSCPCVPYYQCESGIPCTDGCDAIDPKINDGTCSDPTHVKCCNGVNNVTVPTSTRPKLDPVNTPTVSCPCIPSYQCENGIPCTDGCDGIDPKINDGTCSDPTHVRCCNNGVVATSTRPKLDPVNTPTVSCPCIPSYQCENGIPCTDGCDAINPKINDGTCSDPTHVRCCNVVIPKDNMSSCPCVPYYQCFDGSTCTDGCDVVDVRINDNTCLDPSHVRCCKGVNNTVTTTASPMTRDSNTTVITSKNQLSSCSCINHYNCYNGTPCIDGCGVIDMRIHHDSCKLPNVLCCEQNNTKPKGEGDEGTTPSSPSAYKRIGCGVRNPIGIGFRIIDTKTNLAHFGEFPWMVAILWEDKDTTDTQEYYPEQTLLQYQCGGSLIHPQVVLTSAHCVVSKEKTFHVRAGEWDIKRTDETYPHQDRVVEKVIIHPEFYSGGLYNDIALLILKAPVNITINVDTVCLPAQDEILEDIRCFTSGWGKNVFQRNGQYETALKKVRLPIVQKDICQNQLRAARSQDDFVLDESFVCAGGEKDKDACEGDGGSPLACPFSNNPKRYFQAGIVSWGIGCGLENVPGLYANVALFRNWVDEHMIKLGYDTFYYIY